MILGNFFISWDRCGDSDLRYSDKISYQYIIIYNRRKKSSRGGFYHSWRKVEINFECILRTVLL